jgi:RNA polymerase sigma factor (sigma-70 family)
MQEPSDVQLLREYAECGSDAAFREIVTRHTDLVYSVALRSVNSPDLAGDLAQGVFTDLARKARPVADKLADHASLVGWLYRSARFAALNQLRDDRRRRAHERQAMEQLLSNSETAPDWDRIRPVLDEAMDGLKDEDREALLLRYFKNQDFRAVGLALGVSDDTAQKRVTRAVERLRGFLAKRGVTVGAGGLAVVISANAVQAAPAGLAAAIGGAAVSGTAVTTATVTTTLTKIIAMSTLQKTLAAAVVIAVLASGTGMYLSHQREAARLAVENETDLARDSWRDAGFATPQATLRTMGWSVVNGNRARFKDCLFMTDGARTELAQMIASMPPSEADKKLHPELADMTEEDTMLFPMMAANKQRAFTGYHILSRQTLTSGDRLIEFETQMSGGPAKKLTFKFRRLGSDWKIVIDEDFLKNDVQEMQRMKARR